MNRLFFLLPFAPRLDRTHGSKAIAQLLSRLASRNKLAVVYLRGAGEPPLDERLRDRFDLVSEIERPWTQRGYTATKLQKHDFTAEAPVCAGRQGFAAKRNYCAQRRKRHQETQGSG